MKTIFRFFGFFFAQEIQKRIPTRRDRAALRPASINILGSGAGKNGQSFPLRNLGVFAPLRDFSCNDFILKRLVLLLVTYLLLPATFSIAGESAGGDSCCAEGEEALDYPLDGYDRTGIARLKAFKLVQEGKMRGTARLPWGAKLNESEIKLRLQGINENYDISATTPVEPVLQSGLREILKNRDPHYSIAILDITDPSQPRFAAVQADTLYPPGSIGKLLIMTGLFDQLARVFPDPAARVRILKNTKITADDFALRDTHEVPLYDQAANKISYKIIKPGDTFNLWEWADHMVSPSANAAASMVWKQVMLIDQFKTAYPVSKPQVEAYLKTTKKSLLSEQSVRVLRDPLGAVGLPEEEIRQGTMFTGGGQRAVPGVSSYLTPKQMLRWMLKMEQGKLIDGWSSLEMKKLMYFTRRRYRYASSPALDSAAVFFKSGSLYSCRPEPGFKCKKYMGNAKNFLNSVAIVESPAGSRNPCVYLVALCSNVLKINSAVEHQTIATEIQEMILKHHGRFKPKKGKQAFVDPE